MPKDFNIKLLSDLQEISTFTVFFFEFFYSHLKISQEFAKKNNFLFQTSPGVKFLTKFSFDFRF